MLEESEKLKNQLMLKDQQLKLKDQQREKVIVDNFDNKSIRSLPNPTNGKLEISNAQMEVINVKVYNLLGVLIGNTLDISNCASGIYIVQVETSHGIFSQKVVKK